MAKRRAKKAVKKVSKKADPTERMRGTLAERTKDELIDLLMEFAREDHRFLRRLDARFESEVPPEEIVRLTSIAISDATDFDEREINRNFSYDYAAYDEVKRNLGRLVALGELRRAMELSLELMKEGSYQVEMSDEGMMTHEIEECLVVVINAVRKGGLSAAEVKAWCEAMLKSDRMGFICDEELKSLQRQFDHD